MGEKLEDITKGIVGTGLRLTGCGIMAAPILWGAWEFFRGNYQSGKEMIKMLPVVEALGFSINYLGLMVEGTVQEWEDIENDYGCP